MKNVKRFSSIALFIVMVISLFVPVQVAAATTEKAEDYKFIIDEEKNTITVYMPTDWALIIDGSGSMRALDEEVWATLDYWFGSKYFAFKARFDTKLHPNEMDYISHEDTDIVGALEEVVEVSGYKRVVIVTDGHQDPGIYDELTEKGDIDLHLLLVGENEKAEELIEVLKDHLNEETCSFTIYKGHIFDPIYESYNPPTIEVPYEDNGSELNQKIGELEQKVDEMNAKIVETEEENKKSYQNIQNQLVLILENTEYKHNIFCWIGWILIIALFFMMLLVP